MKNILKTLQQQDDYNHEVEEVVKFIKKGEPTKLRKMKSEAGVEQISHEEMEKVFDEMSCAK